MPNFESLESIVEELPPDREQLQGESKNSMAF